MHNVCRIFPGKNRHYHEEDFVDILGTSATKVAKNVEVFVWKS